MPAENKAVVDMKLHSRMLQPGESLWTYAVLASPLPGRLWANMTSSTKPEVRNVLHCRQRRSEPWLQLENFVKSEHCGSGFW